MKPEYLVFLFPVVGLLIPIFAILAVLRVFSHKRKADAARARVDVQMRLLDKIEKSDDLRAYLESGAARQMMDALSPAPDEAYGRILIPASAGAALLVAGLCLIGAAVLVGENWIGALGLLAVVSGLACLVGAFVSYRLSKSWGLLDRLK